MIIEQIKGKTFHGFFSQLFQDIDVIFQEIYVNWLLEERFPSVLCPQCQKNLWEKKMLDCQISGYACTRCGKETLL